MTTLRLTLSDQVLARLQARASESGYASVEGFAEALLRAEAEMEQVDEPVERLLLGRLEDPSSIELTPAFRKQFLQELRDRRQGRCPQP